MVQLGDMQCFEVSLQPHKFILGHHPLLALQTPFMIHYGSESLGLLLAHLSNWVPLFC